MTLYGDKEHLSRDQIPGQQASLFETSRVPSSPKGNCLLETSRHQSLAPLCDFSSYVISPTIIPGPLIGTLMPHCHTFPELKNSRHGKALQEIWGQRTGWRWQRNSEALKLSHLSESCQLRLHHPESAGTPRGYVLGQGRSSTHISLRVISVAYSTSTTVYALMLSNPYFHPDVPECHGWVSGWLLNAQFPPRLIEPPPHTSAPSSIAPSTVSPSTLALKSNTKSQSWPPGSLCLAFHSCSTLDDTCCIHPHLSIHSTTALIKALEPSLTYDNILCFMVTLGSPCGQLFCIEKIIQKSLWFSKVTTTF